MPFIVATFTYNYASSQGQRTHSARTKRSCNWFLPMFRWVTFPKVKRLECNFEMILEGVAKSDKAMHRNNIHDMLYGLWMIPCCSANLFGTVYLFQCLCISLANWLFGDQMQAKVFENVI